MTLASSMVTRSTWRFRLMPTWLDDSSSTHVVKIGSLESRFMKIPVAVGTGASIVRGFVNPQAQKCSPSGV